MKEKIEKLIAQSKAFLKEEQIVTDKEGMAHYCYDATEMQVYA